MNFYAIIQRFSPSRIYEFIICENNIHYASYERFSSLEETISIMNSKARIKISEETFQKVLKQCDVIFESEETFTLKEVLENKPEILL